MRKKQLTQTDPTHAAFALRDNAYRPKLHLLRFEGRWVRSRARHGERGRAWRTVVICENPAECPRPYRVVGKMKKRILWTRAMDCLQMVFLYQKQARPKVRNRVAWRIASLHSSVRHRRGKER